MIPLRSLPGLGHLILSLTLSCVGIRGALISEVSAKELSYQQRIRQVELYIDSKLYDQALKELKLLERTPEGGQDVRVAHSYALAHYNTFNVNQALFYLRRARTLTADMDLKAQLTQTYQRWIKAYGLVNFQSLNQVQRGAIKLETERVIINPKRRKSFKIAQRLLAEGVTTPISFYLPFGSYTANDVEFQLKSSLPPPTVELMLTPVHTEPVSTKSSKWVYITLGGVALIATAVGGYYLLTSDSSEGQGRLIKLE